MANQQSADFILMNRPTPVLKIKDLKVRFSDHGNKLYAVNGVNLQVNRGQIHGLVGESGCGKTVTGMSIARLVPTPPAEYTGGKIVFQGNNIMKMGTDELRAIRGRDISYVFQEPQVSFNPVLTIGSQIAETVKLHLGGAKVKVREKVIEALAEVGIACPEQRYNDYPHQMSGGMLQRAMIAMAVVCRPSLIIADEPTTALDVTIQAQILEMLTRISRQMDVSMLLISHDLGVIYEIADYVSVMYAGCVVERADKATLFEEPLHPYTKGLLASLPTTGMTSERLTTIKGRVEPQFEPPTACGFCKRCPHVMDECTQSVPPEFATGGGHFVRCFLYKKRQRHR